MPYKDPEVRKAKAREAAKRRRAEHPEKYREIDRKRRARNIEAARRSTREYMRRWRAENREADRLRMAQWRAENPGRDAEFSRNWRKKNPDKMSELSRNRRARVKGALVERITAEMWEDVCRLFSNRCAYCFEPADLQMDHVEPLSLGGLHEIDNVAPACLACNSSKNDDRLVVWMSKQAKLRRVLANAV